MAINDTHEGRIKRLEERADMTEVAVEALQNAFASLSNAFTAYTTATNQTIADILEHEQNGGTITGSELAPITEGLATLTTAVEQATATVKGEDPGPVTESVPVGIDSAGEGSTEIAFAASRVSITTQPESGSATLEAVEVEGQPPATRVRVTGAAPESTQTVVVSIAAE